MLRARLDAALLHPQDRLIRGLAGQEGVRAEALPVAAALRDAAHVHHRPKRDVDALAFVLLAHGEPASAHELALEGRGGIDPGGEDGGEVGVAHAEG